MRAIIHIGAGKTGTSSIQSSLKKNKQRLLEEGYIYAGNCFNSFTRSYSWQKKNFGFAASSEVITEKFIHGFTNYTQNIAKNEAHTLILCNEVFSSSIEKLIPFLNWVKERAELEICFYVREPKSWTKSAYQQWGIRHKTNHGSIIPAEEYISERPYNRMKATHQILLDNGFESEMTLRNYNKSTDSNVVTDFCQLYELPDLEISNTNTASNRIEEALFFYLNNISTLPQLPRKGRMLSGLYNSANNEQFIKHTEIKDNDFDQCDVENFVRYFNDYLSDDHLFQSEVQELNHQSSCTESELKLAKVSATMFQLADQTNNRKKILIQSSEILEESHPELAEELKRLTKYYDRFFPE